MHPWDHGALRPWGIETMGLWDYEIWDGGNFGPYLKYTSNEKTYLTKVVTFDILMDNM